MAIHKEPLNKGLVQVRDPLLLNAGEVQEATDCILRPGDPAIQKAPGRTAYGTVLTTDVTCSASSGATTLTSSSGFGTDIASVNAVENSAVLNKTSAFAAAAAGQEVICPDIVSPAYIDEVIDDDNIRVSKPYTGTSGAVTITLSDLHPGTFLTGTDIHADAQIDSITDASSLEMTKVTSGVISSATITFTEEIQGLRGLVFDNDADVLLAKIRNKLYSSDVSGTTGTFAAVAGVSDLAIDDDAFLDTIAFKDRHILLTGFDKPRVLQYDEEGTLEQRKLGLEAVSDFVGPAIDDNGQWRTDDGWGDGYYWFLVTEAILDGTNEVESTFTGEPQYAHITDAANQGITITYRKDGTTAVNDGNNGTNTATHWRVYMSKRQENVSTRPLLNDFHLLTDVDITANSVDLRTNGVYQSGYASGITDPDDDGNFTDYKFFEQGSTKALAQVAAQTVSNCVATEGSAEITSSAGFGTVTEGMYVTSPTNNLPYGTYVIKKINDSTIRIGKGYFTGLLFSGVVATVTEDLYFGNEKSWDGAMDFVNTNPVDFSGHARAALFKDFGIQNQGAFSTSVITGVKVQIPGRYIGRSGNNYDHLWVKLFVDPGASPTYSSAWKKATFVGTDFDPNDHVEYKTGIITLGSSSDTWGLALDPSYFVNGAGKFGVLVRKRSGIPGGDIDHVWHYIDAVRITVYASTTNINTEGKRFKTITLEDGVGTNTDAGAAGPPPRASTGDIFEGMLILNDIDNRNRLVASLPDAEESFPALYTIQLESKARDQITVIKRLSQSIIVGCEGSIKRLNYFPRETDAEYNRGRAYEDVANDHGMVGPRAARLLDLPGRGTILTYLSNDGLRWTDGITTSFLNDDLNWSTLINPTYLHRSILEVHPGLNLLALYYVPFGETDPWKRKCMYFSYHPMHVKEGFRLPAVGPVTARATSAATLLYSGVWYLYTGHPRQGKVFLEDQGTTDAAGENIFAQIRTRRFMPADLGKTARIKRVFWYADADGNATTGLFGSQFRRQNQGEDVTLAETSTLSTETGGIIEAHQDNEVETFDLRAFKSGSQTADLRIHFVGFDFTPLGRDRND
jgi:hypothetical protein